MDALFDRLRQAAQQPTSDLAIVLGTLLAAWLVHRLARPLARRVVRLDRVTGNGPARRAERRETLQGLVADIISFFAFATAALIVVQRLFDVSSETLIWTVSLFSAAFGFGARPLISDILAGMSFIFEDAFAVGEKVGLHSGAENAVEGVVEAVRLRTTRIRASTGELCVIPNGEIRALRNYSRGRFSTANVTLRLPSDDLLRALPLLEALGQEAVELLPNLIEPWQVISQSGEIGDETELTLVAKARFATGADLRPKLLALVKARLSEAGIGVAGRQGHRAVEHAQ